MPAYAYVDPSVITYTIQAVAGVIVALGAVVGVAFRRSRKALIRLLHIDENARKEVEDNVHRIDGNGNPIPTAQELESDAKPEDATSSEHAKEPRKQIEERTDLKWPSRLWRSVLASVLLVGTLLVVAPAEMVSASAQSLVFSLADVWASLLIQAGIIAACLAIALSLFRGRAFDFLFALIVALGFGLYIQALFLNQTLPSADGSPFELDQHVEITILSTLAWLAVIAIAIVLFARRRRLGRGIGVFVCIALIAMQGAAVASLMLDADNSEFTPVETTQVTIKANGSAIVTKEGLYEVSPKGNVIVFVLDTFDVIDMNDLLDSDPSILSEMTGFTYYKNSTGSSTPTRYGLPFLLTGAWPQADQTWDEYLDTRYTSTSFTDDIVGAGYALYVYTDTLGRGGIEHLEPLATNIHELDDKHLNTTSTLHLEGALGILYKMALYRDLPWIFKGPFWFYTDEVNQAVYDVETYEKDVDVSSRVGGKTPYIMDDAAFYQQLLSRKLHTYEDDNAKGALHFIHLNGLHTPYTLNEQAQRVDKTKTTRYQQTIGSLQIIDEYLRQLKELGRYDDACIIITADHGMWPWETTIEQSEADGDMAGGPIMLVKPSQTPEQAAQPCKISNVRTGHLDYPATVIQAVGANAKSYGMSVFDAEQANDQKRIRYYYWPTHDGTTDLTIYEYAIDGEVTNWYAWQRTGVQWAFNTPASETL